MATLVLSSPAWSAVLDVVPGSEGFVIRERCEERVAPTLVSESAPAQADTESPDLSSSPSEETLRVYFASGSARMETAYARRVAALASGRFASVRVTGHSDATGGEAANLRLSQARAAAVAKALSAAGMDPDRIETVAAGSGSPECADSTADCLARNRRALVEVIR